MSTPNLNLPFIVQGQAQKEVTHNEALRILDVLVQLAVLDRDLSAPPGSPSEGQRWIVGASPTGAWVGHANHIAAWQDGAWQFSVPKAGWLAYVIDERALLAWDGTAWVDALAAIATFQNLALLGVNTSADAINRLAVKSDAVLLSHDDVTPGTGDMRVNVNKAGTAKDAGFVFQTGWSTRALFGLLGDEHFQIKVSPDGANFRRAIDIDNASGHVGLGTSADANNGVSAKLNTALWTAKTAGEGGTGDLRYTLNKAASGNTLSLLFQTNFSGRAELGLAGDDDFHLKVSPDGSNWFEALVTDRTTGEVIVGGWRVGRDAVINVLPDSGRFNGNNNNLQFAGIAYVAPSYLTPESGAAIAAHAKFVHDNSTYGGAGSALDAEVNALISKIRPNASDRRYGPEWYVLLITQTTGSLSEAQNIGGTNYGLAFTNTFTALPRKYTAGFYVKVKTGSAAIVVPAASKGRAYIDGVLYAGGSAPVVLQNADGWKYVNLQSGPNQFFYNYRAFDVILPAGAQIYFAMPRFVFGHVNLDPNLGVLMNDKMFG